jgi:nucleotide-binding universal stress UspA family protein
MSVQYKKILVTLDGSDFAAQALPHAQMLAHALEAELILFRAVSEVEVESHPSDIVGMFINVKEPMEEAAEISERKQIQVITAAERELEALIQPEGRQGIQPQIVVEVGKPAECILEYTQHHEVDLIVMSTHGRSGLSHLVYGSVAEEVLHKSRCPVLLVRPSKA